MSGVQRGNIPKSSPVQIQNPCFIILKRRKKSEGDKRMNKSEVRKQSYTIPFSCVE